MAALVLDVARYCGRLGAGARRVRDACAFRRMASESACSCSPRNLSCNATKRPVQYADGWAVWICKGLCSGTEMSELLASCGVDDADEPLALRGRRLERDIDAVRFDKTLMVRDIGRRESLVIALVPDGLDSDDEEACGMFSVSRFAVV